MTTLFDQDYNDAMFPILLEHHGESIGFRATSAGSTRTITALVDRTPPEPTPGAPQGLSNVIRFSVYNDSTSGISSDEVDEGTNEISIAPRIGASAVWMSLHLLDHDSGLCRFEAVGG